MSPFYAEVRLIDSPENNLIFVALDRIRPCPKEMTDETWTGLNKTAQTEPNATNGSSKPNESGYAGPITRSMARKLEI